MWQNMLEWETYQSIASFYRYRVPPADSEEVVQTIVVEMAEAALRRDGQATPKPYLEAIARNVVSDYWRARRKRPLSLNRPTRDTGGMELHETLPGDTGDHDSRLDAKLGLKACSPGIQKIARKLEKGDPLTPGQEACLRRFRRNGKLSPQQRWWWKRYRRRRSLGLCVDCGHRAEEGFARCARCLDRHRRHQAFYKKRKGLSWQAKLREHWRKEERCPRCGRPSQPGRKKCPRCLARDREHLRRWRAERGYAMNREELARKLQEVTGVLMALEQGARKAGDDKVAKDLERARKWVVRAGRRVEPPPRSTESSRCPCS